MGPGSRSRRDSVLDLLSALVDKSLVVAEAETEGALRYGMLEPVRQFGREKLRRERGGAGGPPPARRALPGPRREGRTRAVGAGSGPVAPAAQDRVREPQGGARMVPGARRRGGARVRLRLRLRGRVVAVLGRASVSRKANGGCRRRWRGTPEGSPPSGQRRSMGSASSSFSSKTTDGR